MQPGKAEPFRTSSGGAANVSPMSGVMKKNLLGNRNQGRFAVGMAQGEVEFSRDIAGTH